jgi:hypothetical protein
MKPQPPTPPRALPAAPRLPAPADRALRLSDVRGAARLAVQATLGATDIAEQLHHSILRRARPWQHPQTEGPGPTGGITGLVYRSVRGVTQGVGQGLDLLLGPVAERALDTAPAQQWLARRSSTEAVADVPAGSAARQRHTVLAALNGVLGDHLHDSGNPLALPMVLQHQGRVLELPPPGARLAGLPPRGRVLLMVHGLCMHPGQWQPAATPAGQARPAGPGVDLGAALAADGDLCLLHLHYNTGLPVATNGRTLADRLQALVQAWPVPLEELVVVGHSMGGLVARSACLQAQARGHDWVQRLRSLVCLGTPHAGAPLERGGRVVDLLLGASPYTAAFGRLGRLRSAGITDLRHGTVHPAAPGPRPPAPLPAHVRCFAVAGQLRGGVLSHRFAGPAGERGLAWLGDGLVPVDSALGRHDDAAHALQFPPEHRWVAQGLDHFELMTHPEVLARLRHWQVVAPAGARASARRLPPAG